ncbi:hypothetical protein MKW98_010650, partial [Papaver atlanticum]
IALLIQKRCESVTRNQGITWMESGSLCSIISCWAFPHSCNQSVGSDKTVTLKIYAVSIVGPFPTAVTNLLDLTRVDKY